MIIVLFLGKMGHVFLSFSIIHPQAQSVIVYRVRRIKFIKPPANFPIMYSINNRLDNKFKV